MLDGRNGDADADARVLEEAVGFWCGGGGEGETYKWRAPCGARRRKGWISDALVPDVGPRCQWVGGSGFSDLGENVLEGG